MKAKIRKTGEIVNIAAYAKIALEQCDSYGNPIELKPEEVELIQEQTKDEHWQDVRERAAIAAMQAILSCGKGAFSYQDVIDAVVKVSVCCANSLIAELKKKEQ